MQGRPVQVSKSHWRVLTATPHLILTRLAVEGLDILLGTFHAPHSGLGQDRVQGFWDDVRKAIPAHLKHLPLVLAGDANARLGSITSPAVGHFAAEEENESGQILHAFLVEKGLCAPSTWEGLHTGPSSTWTHPSGKESRIDFTLIPQGWMTCSVRSWVDDSLNVNTFDHDHKAVLLDVQGWMPGARKTVKPKPCLGPYDDTGLMDTGTGAMEAFARRLKPISWTHDVHQHAGQLIEQMHVAAEKVLSKRKPFHSKPFFSDETREAILYKQMWRTRMLKGRRELKDFWISLVFKVWQKKVCPWGWLKVKDDILVQLHWGQGVFQWCFMAMRNWATTLARRDAHQFWEGLASRLPDAEDNKDPREWWRLVQRHLPKTKARNDALAAERNERLQGQWRPYLCALEAGSETSLVDLYREVVEEHQNKTAVAPMVEDLPSLLDLERVLRDTKAKKAPTGYLVFGYILAPTC